MTNIKKFLVAGALIVGLQNINMLPQSYDTNLQKMDIYKKFVYTVSKINTYSFEQEYPTMNSEQLKEFKKGIRNIQLPFLFITEKAKTFILAERLIVDFETLTKKIAHNTLQEFMKETDYTILSTIIYHILQTTAHPEDEFLLIFLSLLDHEINKIINTKNGTYIDQNTTNALLRDATGILLALYLYEAVLSNPKHPINN